MSTRRFVNFTVAHDGKSTLIVGKPDSGQRDHILQLNARETETLIRQVVEQAGHLATTAVRTLSDRAGVSMLLGHAGMSAGNDSPDRRPDDG